jgi:hypothetical protein
VRIRELLETDSVCPSKTTLLFSLDKEAARNNDRVLEECDFDIDKLIAKFKGSHLDYGSEFRDPDALQKVFGKHPNWPRVNSYLRHGIPCPLVDIPEEERLRDLEEAIN